MPVVELASPSLSSELLSAIQSEVAEHATLERVVHWGLSRSPARLVAEVVKQDEFTQDVVIVYRDEIHLAYDST